MAGQPYLLGSSPFTVTGEDLLSEESCYFLASRVWSQIMEKFAKLVHSFLTELLTLHIMMNLFKSEPDFIRRKSHLLS